MSLILYQFPISHFCEKVRFSLDYKGIDYRVINLVPGLHIKTITRLAPRSSVPVISHESRIIQGSATIVSYLDEIAPDKRLTPVDDEQHQAAIEWEQWLDSGVGIDVRRYCYHYLLPNRRIITNFFISGASVKGRLFLLFGYGKLVKLMRKFMDINEATAAESLQRMQAALDRLANHYEKNDFLVGNAFSRADIAAASLFAPMFQPKAYGLSWPERLPEPLQTTACEMAPRLEWAERIYRDYRKA